LRRKFAVAMGRASLTGRATTRANPSSSCLHLGGTALVRRRSERVGLADAPRVARVQHCSRGACTPKRQRPRTPRSR
jgi:hypothetical protein